MRELQIDLSFTYKGEEQTETILLNEGTESEALSLAASQLADRRNDEREGDADEIEISEDEIKILAVDCVEDAGDHKALPEFWQFAEAYCECEQDADVVLAALECGVQGYDIDEAYNGAFSSDEDFAREMADQLGAVDKNAAWPNNCIDWEFAAKELMYDYCESNGHYFRNL